MAPILSEHDIAYHSLINTMPISKSLLRDPSLGVLSTHRANLLLGELGGRVTCSGVCDTFAHSPSPFLGHISQIVGLGSEKQMVWPNTRANVASVADKFPLGDPSFGQSISKSMSKPWPKCAIPILAKRSDPHPTEVSFMDLAPKSFNIHSRVGSRLPPLGQGGW